MIRTTPEMAVVVSKVDYAFDTLDSSRISHSGIRSMEENAIVILIQKAMLEQRNICITSHSHSVTFLSNGTVSLNNECWIARPTDIRTTFLSDASTASMVILLLKNHTGISIQ